MNPSQATPPPAPDPLAHEARMNPRVILEAAHRLRTFLSQLTDRIQDYTEESEIHPEAGRQLLESIEQALQDHDDALVAEVHAVGGPLSAADQSALDAAGKAARGEVPA